MLHKTEVQSDLPKAVSQILNFISFCSSDFCPTFRDDGQQNDVLVKGATSLHEMHEDRWNMVDTGGDKYRGARNACDETVCDLLMDDIKRRELRCIFLFKECASTVPDQHGGN